MSEGSFWNRLKGTLQPKREEAPRASRAAPAAGAPQADAADASKLELVDASRPFAGPSIVHQKPPPAKGSHVVADDSEFKRDRIRTRYFKARFVDVALPAAGSTDPTAMIRAARLFYEDGDAARAVELLQAVSRLMPGQIRILLANLQIHYLCHDRGGYVATAKALAERFPGAAEWADVARMGARIAPGEALFPAAGDAGAGGQMDAWPAETLNWIETSRDSSGDAIAKEFRARALTLPTYSTRGPWR
jgi:hypothetical protein